jgi:hypothetical protein
MARTSEAQALAWTAQAAFNKGAFLIYAGQESGTRQTPSLFEREPVAWDEYRLQSVPDEPRSVEERAGRA